MWSLLAAPSAETSIVKGVNGIRDSVNLVFWPGKLSDTTGVWRCVRGGVRADSPRCVELQFRGDSVVCGRTIHVHSAEGSKSAPQFSGCEYGADPHQHWRVYLSGDAAAAGVQGVCACQCDGAGAVPCCAERAWALGGRARTRADEYVSAWRDCALAGQHAVSVDLWGQRRGFLRACELSVLLFVLWRGGGVF